jgi:uncharacterized protein (DUF952 family)
MDIIYHLVPAEYFKSIPTDQAYQPADFAREGFIHCTRGPEQLVVVANRYYRDDPRSLLVLVIDADRVQAEVRNEAAADEVRYPHIYGPLNRAAIISALHMPRLPDGSFQFPDRFQTSR